LLLAETEKGIKKYKFIKQEK